MDFCLSVSSIVQFQGFLQYFKYITMEFVDNFLFQLCFSVVRDVQIRLGFHNSNIPFELD